MKLIGRSTAVLALALPLIGAASAPAKAMQADCTAGGNTFLFWPQGHGAVPGAGFPEFRTPHVEAYGGLRTGNFFPSSATEAYLDATGANQVAKHCTTKPGGFSPKKVAAPKTKSTATRFLCHGFMVFRLGTITGGTRLQGLVSGKLTLDLKVTTTHAKAIYDPKRCKAAAPPS